MVDISTGTISVQKTFLRHFFDIFIHFDEVAEELPEHPLFDILADASEWLTPLWPTMMALLETKMQHPGAPDATFDDFGFGHHEDLIP